MTHFYLKLLILLFCLIVVENAKILGVFTSTGYSQFILADKLMSELARRGHQVTIISAYQPDTKIENYETVLIEEILEDLKVGNLFELEDVSVFKSVDSIYELGYTISEATLKHDSVQKLLNSNQTFDLVIVEQFYNEALSAFAYHYRAPLILFSSIGPSEWNNYMMGNPGIPSISPLAVTPYSRHMSFFERLSNLIVTIYDKIQKELIALPKHQRLVNTYFPKSINLIDVLYNTSLMLLNSHITTSENAPLVHGMVEIGGFHVSEKGLSKDVQKYLDNADNGAIYFSLGTNLRVNDLTKEQIKAIIDVFSKLPQRIVWKTNQQFENLPTNVFVSNWFSQCDILAHPNVKLFITHGGLSSITEAVFYGKPLLGIPIFGDQKMNMMRAERRGFAKSLPFKQLNEINLYRNIKEVIENSKYSDNARLMSNLMRDTVVKPLDLAMFWIEYVIRQKGFRLKSPASDLYWYQLYMLDIVAFLLFNLILFVVIFKISTRLLLKKM